MSTVLEVKNLRTEINTDQGSFLAVNGVSFQLQKGEILGIVGESGCGKSITSLSILRLLSSPLKVVEGEILFYGEDLLKVSEKRIRQIRGNKVSMIFQEPMTSLNPVFTCGEQVAESIRLHQPELSKAQVKQKTLQCLKSVGIPDVEKRYYDYPHQLSGGMRQRVMIAMALSCDPDLLIADEPTTALDVTIQAQILSLLRRSQKDLQASVILITHDLGIIAEMCDRVIVMYAGRIVEEGTVEDIFYRSRHPYTFGLMQSLPRISKEVSKKPLTPIPGLVPSVFEVTTGCRFYDRCFARQEKCLRQDPELILQGHKYACHFPLKIDGGQDV